MKLPNGYGTVYKLSGKRRNPFIVRKTTGWTDEGKQIYTTLGYYPTRTKALQALAEYNNNPYDLLMSKMTFSQVYEKWFNSTFDDNTNRSTIKNYSSVYKYCTALYDMPMCEIRLQHMQKIIDENSDAAQTASRLKVLFNKLYVWCIQNDYVKKNYAEYLKATKKESANNSRRAFSQSDINTLWSVADKNPNAPIVLMLIYCGVRISELLDLKKEDVNLEEQWFKVRASKTNAGIRVVPIADKVLSFWKSYMERSNCEYAVCTTAGEKLQYDNFKRNYWKPLMDMLNMDYTPHETRHTCISLLVMSNCNPTTRKKIVGHKSQMDLGEAVYTHIYVEELLKAINKI